MTCSGLNEVFCPEGPRCPSDSQDPHWCSGEEQHSTQTHPGDEEMGRVNGHSKSRAFKKNPKQVANKSFSRLVYLSTSRLMKIKS